MNANEKENPDKIFRENDFFRLEERGNGILFVLKNTKPYKTFNLTFEETSRLLATLALFCDDIERRNAFIESRAFRPTII